MSSLSVRPPKATASAAEFGASFCKASGLIPVHQSSLTLNAVLGYDLAIGPNFGLEILPKLGRRRSLGFEALLEIRFLDRSICQRVTYGLVQALHDDFWRPGGQKQR